MLQEKALVTTEISDGVAIVTMRRPEKRNALSLEVMRELQRAFPRSAKTEG